MSVKKPSEVYLVYCVPNTSRTVNLVWWSCRRDFSNKESHFYKKNCPQAFDDNEEEAHAVFIKEEIVQFSDEEDCIDGSCHQSAKSNCLKSENSQDVDEIKAFDDNEVEAHAVFIKEEIVQFSDEEDCIDGSCHQSAKSNCLKSENSQDVDEIKEMCEPTLQGCRYKSDEEVPIHIGESNSTVLPLEFVDCSCIEEDDLCESIPPRIKTKHQFKCSYCSRVYLYQSDLRIHLRKHTGERPYQFTICNKAFSEKFVLNRHLRTHDGRPFQCTICSKGFSEKVTLDSHLITHTDDRPFQCTICNKKISIKSKLNIHSRTHAGERPFQCTICTKMFTQKSHLSSHMMTHTGERSFQCTICTKMFSKKSNLNKHMKTHSDERPFQCTICTKMFSNKSNLNKHTKTHSDERPFQCTICTKMFSNKCNLNKHTKTHSDERPFQCTICTKWFSQMRYLNRHMITHIGNRETPFQCAICTKMFSRKAVLKRHIMRKHTD